MTIAWLNARITEELKKNRGKVVDRRSKIKEVRQGLDLLAKGRAAPRLERRYDVWFSTTQGNIQDVREQDAKRTVNVQYRGIQVGELKVDLNDSPPSWRFHPSNKRNKDLTPPFADLPRKGWEWNDNVEDEKCLRDFIGRCEKHPRAGEKTEREIQWQLADAFRTGAIKFEAWTNLEPVMWDGYFAEVGISVTEKGVVPKKNSGTIDLLLRSDSDFIVLELKKPGKKGIKYVREAVYQAVRYATALDIEANGNEDNEADPENRKIYREVFGSKGEKELKINVMVALQDTLKLRKELADLLPKLCLESDGSRITRIGALLYTLPDNKTCAWESYVFQKSEMGGWSWHNGKAPDGLCK